jgi:hypothetical protein
MRKVNPKVDHKELSEPKIYKENAIVCFLDTCVSSFSCSIYHNNLFGFPKKVIDGPYILDILEVFSAPQALLQCLHLPLLDLNSMF